MLYKVGVRIDKLIRPISYSLFLISAGIEIWLLIWASPKIQEPLLLPATILLSAIMATCGWMWSGHINRRLARKAAALELLIQLRSPQINSWKRKIYRYVDERDKDGPSPQIPGQEAEQLLGYYELIAIAVMNGTVDESAIKESQMFVFHRIYTGLSGFIAERQKTDNSIYCHFCHYAQEWGKTLNLYTPPSFIKPDREFF